MAGRRTRYLGVSSNDGIVVCAAWACLGARKTDSTHPLFISKRNNGNQFTLEIANYSFDEDVLQDEVFVLRTEEVPQAIAAHPAGHVILCCFPNYCRVIEVINGELRLSEEDSPALRSIGPQHKVAFSVDGCRLAFGGKDGHLRVYDWPSLNNVIDEPNAHKSIKDLDFSLDGALLASTSDDGPCRIWDLDKAAPLTSLHRDKNEKFGFCKFSRNGAHPFLFVTSNRERKGYVAVWEIAKWSRLGSKKFMDEEISAFTTSCDGKRLACGGIHGDVTMIEVKKMEKKQHVNDAHLADVYSVELSPNSRALLSVSKDGTVRVTATNIAAPWKDWQVYMLLIGLVVLSAVLFYIFFEYSDSFWKFPLGRNQPARSPGKAIYGEVVSDDSTSGW